MFRSFSTDDENTYPLDEPEPHQGAGARAHHWPRQLLRHRAVHTVEQFPDDLRAEGQSHLDPGRAHHQNRSFSYSYEIKFEPTNTNVFGGFTLTGGQPGDAAWRLLPICCWARESTTKRIPSRSTTIAATPLRLMSTIRGRCPAGLTLNLGTPLFVLPAGARA